MEWSLANIEGDIIEDKVPIFSKRQTVGTSCRSQPMVARLLKEKP
jgi:hypothetical protein